MDTSENDLDAMKRALRTDSDNKYNEDNEANVDTDEGSLMSAELFTLTESSN